MENIKFRAWDNNLKEYLEYENYIFDPENGDVLDYGWNDTLTVNEDAIVEQYTGLKDKNGVKIFEGDIVRQQMRFDETNGFIFWEQEKARFSINLDGFITTITRPQEHSYEVVGNIHQNPELLIDPDLLPRKDI